mgnify:CR=1 FL=1
MRKLLIVALMLAGLTQLNSLTVLAEPIACSGNRFSVQTIDGQNVFTEQSCFALTDYDQAVVAMNDLALTRQNIMIVYYGDNPLSTFDEGDNPLTPGVDETSYKKIVAGDRAMAYSANVAYANSTLLLIFPTSNLKSGTDFTYIDERNPLFYYGTTKTSSDVGVKTTPSNLSALISVNGAKGYVLVSHIQIVPLIYVDNGWNFTFDLSTSTRTIPAQQAYYTVSENTVSTKEGSIRLRELTLNVNFISSSTQTYTIDKAPEWLANGRYYSPDGIVFYTDVDLKNPVKVNGQILRYYNYYSFTNLRSKTTYSYSDLDAYTDYYLSYYKINPILSTMVNSGKDFIEAQNLYGMNALMIYAMGAHESAFGRSTYAQHPPNLKGTIVIDYSTKALLPYTVAEFCTLYPNNRYFDENGILYHCNGRNNLFGWGAYDTNPDKAAYFPTIKDGITQHMGINLRRGYMNPDDYKYYGSIIGNKGTGFNTNYASDPWWSVGISGIAYRVDRYLGLKDRDQVPLGIRHNSIATVIYKDPQLSTPYLNSANKAYTIPTRATNTPFIILEGLEVNGQLVYKIQTTNPINEDGTVNQVSDRVLVPYDFARSVGYISATVIDNYLTILVTGVTNGASYNTDKQIFFESGTVTLNGTPITTGTVVSAEGTYQIVATSPSGIRQNLTFTIDKTAPLISLDPYLKTPTNQDITVRATVNEGTLNTASKLFTDNGEFTFIATDAAGNVSTQSVSITNIDKVAPIITIDPFDSTTITNLSITVTASTNEGSLNTASHTFDINGSFTFIATDAAGNITEQTVTVNNIVLSVILTLDTPTKGTLSANIGEQVVESGQTVHSTDEIVLTLVLNPTYRIFKWLINDTEVSPTSTSYVLAFPAVDTRVGVIVVKEGDLNDDDKLSATDLVKLRRSLAGLDSINEKSAMAADINGDGKVTTTDLVRIRRILAGLE